MRSPPLVMMKAHLRRTFWHVNSSDDSPHGREVRPTTALRSRLEPVVAKHKHVDSMTTIQKVPDVADGRVVRSR